MSRKSIRRRSIDWRIIALWLMLVAIGWLSIYASIHSTAEGSILDFSLRSGKQFAWILGAAMMGFLVVFVIKPHVWEVLSTPAYILVLLLLAAVIVFGSSVNGSKSWFHLGPLSFQPSEISKITTSLVLAHLMRGNELKKGKDLRQMILTVLLPMIIILAEGETGTILVYIGYLFVLYREGLSGWWIVALGGFVTLFILSLSAAKWVAFVVLALVVGIYWAYMMLSGHLRMRKQKRSLTIAAVLTLLIGSIYIFSTGFVFEKVLRPHQKARIEILLGIREDIRGAGYNVNQSKIAIGSGGFFGKGYLKGTQTAFGFVPEQSTDFIFCTVGEEAGFVGGTLLILLFMLLIFFIMQDADACREPFTRVYGYCVASFLMMHLAINVGMTIGLMPVIGIPLPFISYGGSSLMSFSLMLFIFVALYSREKRYY